MEDSGGVLALQDYIRNVDRSSLPRILQVCSGVYFQGSVYEISGCEVCLSTGDLVKITGIKLLSVSCTDIINNTSFELPLDFADQFTLVPEKLPYNTIEEIVGLLPDGMDAFGSFTFFSNNELIIENLTVPARTEITILTVELNSDAESFARCRLMGQQETFAVVHLPFSCHGEFYECQINQDFSIVEIMHSARLCRRRFYKTKPNTCNSQLVFNPIYEIKGIMHMRKNIVMFPSTLEVDVIDVTEHCKNMAFANPLSLAEVAVQPKEAFPTLAEILEVPVANRFFCCSWLKELQIGKHLVLHKCNKARMVLACTPKGRKKQQYFIISEEYGGHIKKQAREFSSVYEVYMAFTLSPALVISVTRHFEGIEEEGVPALSAGEQLEVIGLHTVNRPGNGLEDPQSVETLICKKIEDEGGESDDNEENESSDNKIGLPLFTSAHFVEKLSDKKKYRFVDLVKNDSFPLNVKVVNPDKILEKDPLAGLAALKLEGILEEMTVVVSFLDAPHKSFELPARWLQMSLSFMSDPLPTPYMRPGLHLETITEVTEHFYHEYQKVNKNPIDPPPRPPKRTTVASQKGVANDFTPDIKGRPAANPEHPSLDQFQRRQPPPPPCQADIPPPLIPRKCVSASLAISNMYAIPPRNTEKSQNQKENPYSDHDYEPVEDMLKCP